MTRSGESNEVVARWEGGWRATVTAGPFTLTVDEPPSAGGTHTGPMPTEYLLASLASCYALAVAWEIAVLTPITAAVWWAQRSTPAGPLAR